MPQVERVAEVETISFNFHDKKANEKPRVPS